MCRCSHLASASYGDIYGKTVTVTVPFAGAQKAIHIFACAIVD